MKDKKSLIEEASEKFPDAGSALEALNLYAADIFAQIGICQDEESKEFKRLAAKYHLVRAAYNLEYNRIIELSSGIIK